MDKKLYQRCADKLGSLWGTGGLSSGIYYDFAEKCCEMYLELSSPAKEPVIEADAEKPCAECMPAYVAQLNFCPYCGRKTSTA